MLGEPTNDMDTDMLAAIEDLLDTWPGTLIVVSHDRYLIERVTDQQYAVIGGRLRHLPGGVEEYLRIGAAHDPPQGSVPVDASPRSAGTSSAGERPTITGAERRAAEKERASIERRLERLGAELEAIHARLAAHDQADYEGLAAISEESTAAETEAADLETRWLEITEALGD